MLVKTVSEISDSEKLVVCGDLNAHVGVNADGFGMVHGGNGFGERNLEGEMMLEFVAPTTKMTKNGLSVHFRFRL